MYLKKIEAQGFKSFANKTILEFGSGIMGIVGPNGSGKSNVADAVRWVLGEQSPKQLRGSNMQDVIFSGTELRKPMGYAYVSLTLDNSDHVLPVEYDEVTVTRQVFRSGESEYRLNNNACRLKDIYELFYDSGIGKEGYSIIGQGQIDLVLSNKPDERRQMFDEAAGIVKYKKRRDITQKKLDSERASLQRISDILGEMARQVGPLEAQSAKAKTYLKLKEELKSYEVGAFYLESADLEHKLDSAAANLSLITADLIKAHAEADSLKERYDTLSEKNDALEASLSESRSRLADLRVEKENKEGRIVLLKEQIRTSEASKGLTAERLEAIDQTEKRLKNEREEYYRQKNEADEQIDAADDRVSAVEEEIEKLQEELDDHEFEVERRNRNILDAINRKAELSSELAALSSREEQQRLRESALNKAADERNAHLSSLKEDLDALEAAVDKLNSTAAKRTEEEKQNRAKLAVTEKALAEARTKSQELLREKSVLGSRREALENLVERYEGYGGSIKSVMEQKKTVKGILGVVADLISSDKKYETAIETALGGRIQNVVTDTEETARELIGFLKKNRLGRVTFLPLDAVKGDKEFPQPAALKENGAIGCASDLVKADRKLDQVVRFLLGQVLVADTMEHALSIARRYDHRLHIVTLDGEYLSPGGAISGGAFKNNSNLMGRRRELSEVEAALADAVKNSREAEAAEASLNDSLSSLRAASEKKSKELADLRMKSAALSAQLDARKAELKRLENEQQTDEKELHRIREDLSAWNARKEKLSAQSESLNTGSDTARSEREGLEERIDALKLAIADKNARLEALHLEFSALEQKNEYLLESVRRVNSEIERCGEEKKALLSGGGSEAEAIRIREQEIAELENSLSGADEELNDLEISIAEDTAVRDKQKAEQQGFFAEREELMSRISDLDKESFRLQSQQQRLEEQIEKQAEYLWSEYEMTPTQAKATRNTELKSLNEVKRFINERKSAIRELGTVNVDAIEQYKEVSERYEFLKGQHEDLVKAETELVNIIEGLENGMRKQFREQFAAIKQEFAKVFSELFAGGRGSLELEADEDVLTAGVIINAQPPGKKLQNMMQLSGGEKALTAIALLFAIQNLKPSPFCLLDEIESALDEPNVVRFADYLNRLKHTTQFLVITHRRGTMEMTDRLYGITMQEKGVSALVSVNLTDPGSSKFIDEQ